MQIKNKRESYGKGIEHRHGHDEGLSEDSGVYMARAVSLTNISKNELGIHTIKI